MVIVDNMYSNKQSDMKKVLFCAAMVAALCMASCGKPQQPAETIYSIDEVYTQADSLVGKTITFQGLCSHLCKHGRRKAFLLGSKSDTIINGMDTVIRPRILRVEGGKMGNFDAACINNIIRVKGVLRTFEAQPVANDPNEHHGTDGNGCETEQQAIKGYFAEAISYEIITE